MRVVLPRGGAHRTFDGLFLDIRFDFFFQKKIRLLLWQKRLWWSRGVTSLGGWCSQMLISVSVCVNVRMRARARACVCVCVCVCAGAFEGVLRPSRCVCSLRRKCICRREHKQLLLEHTEVVLEVLQEIESVLPIRPHTRLNVQNVRRCCGYGAGYDERGEVL